MPADVFNEKTERPTERRRREARQQGHVARSTDLVAAGMILAATLLISAFGMSLLRSLAELTTVSLQQATAGPISLRSTVHQFREVGKSLATNVMPIMLLMTAAALLFNLVQVGFLIAPDTMQPKLARLNPIEGIKRIFSLRSLVRLGFTLGKIAVLIAVAAWTIRTFLPSFLALSEQHAPRMASAIHGSLVHLGLQLAAVLIALALIDFAFQRSQHERDLKMSKQEVRDEMKQLEGDPFIRQHRRQAHQALARSHELLRVRESEIVVTHANRIAVALKYNPDAMPAPVLLAKGRGHDADRIRRAAAKRGILVIEQKPLARRLNDNVDIGQAVPPDMSRTVVDLLASVYQITGRTPANLS